MFPISLKIMLHGRLQEGVAEAAGSAPCSGTTPEVKMGGFEAVAENLIGLGYPPERIKAERFGGT